MEILTRHKIKTNCHWLRFTIEQTAIITIYRYLSVMSDYLLVRAQNNYLTAFYTFIGSPLKYIKRTGIIAIIYRLQIVNIRPRVIRSFDSFEIR